MAQDQPLIPETLFDAPSQRLYTLSFGALLQALKLYDVVASILLSNEPSQRLLYKWLLFDTLYLWFLPELRIPRLSFSKRTRLMQIAIFVSLNWIFFGDYSVSLSFLVPVTIRNLFDYQLALAERRVRVQDVVNSGGHLVGEHTVRLSPIASGQLNPYAESYCLGAPSYSVLIPVVFNNSRPHHIQYSIAPLGDRGPRNYINLSSKDLKNIARSYEESLALARRPQVEDDDDDLFEDLFAEKDESPERKRRRLAVALNSATPPLQKTQTLAHLRINRPGVVRLERALDPSDGEIRLRQSEAIVVQCPTVEFEKDKLDNAVKCVGANEELSLKVFGVTPLSLKWHREVQGKREQFVVDGIEGNHDVDRLPLAQELHIPLSLSLNALGRHVYGLDALTDGVGNSIDLSSHTSSTLTTRSLTVLRRSSMSFRNCGSGRPVNLYKGKEARLEIVANDADKEDGPWEVTVQFEPSLDAKNPMKPWTKVFTTMPDKRDMNLLVGAPGDYTIIAVKGKHCPGDVLSPETCRVVELPMPTAEIELRRIHECSGDVGVAASLVLHGTPPFTVSYSTKHDREPEKVSLTKIHGSRGEITLQPERSGSYTYTFKSISDANYENVPLDGPSIDQVVHPLASAAFVHAQKNGGSASKTLLHSCSGNLVDVEVQLGGTAPWNLEVQVVGPKGTQTFNMPGITKSRELVRLPIPKEIDREGGTFQVDLVSVEDANGCKRQLAVPGISINVKRVKPTARFYGQDKKREITVLQGEDAQLPLRLTGEGPWKVSYRHGDDPKNVLVATVQTANGALKVSNAGLYEIIEVRDSHCPGSVIEGEATYTVHWIPRPVAKLPSITRVVQAPNGVHIRPPVCEGQEDHIDLHLEGRPPFQVMYNAERETDHGPITVADQATFSSIQPVSRLQLRTSNPGRVSYELVAIGDASYPLGQKKINFIPPAQRLKLEQEVLARPMAYFKTDGRLQFCLTDKFVPRAEGHLEDSGLVVLSGKPPFVLDITIKNIASNEVHRETVESMAREWKLNFPNYSFNTVGPHLVTIDSVQDSSGCEQAPPDFSRRSIWVDVAETAMIVPFDRREDFCVGDTLQFQLEGTPPWRVKYFFNGKQTVASVKTPQFGRVAEKPGIFSVASIAHQQNMCQTTVSDLKLRIHDIPSARVSHGKKIIEDIREGDQAEIVFELIGEPPFTFTYQRTELERKRGKQPKVLETHTVTGVTTNEYSIFSALEGTWTVTMISDRWCRYPPAPQDLTVEKA